MRQGNGAKGEDQAGSGSGGVGPSVGRTDGENEGLRAGVAETAEVGGEFFGGELLASTIEEDEDGGGAGLVAVEAGKEVSFGDEVLGFAWDVAGGTGEVVGGDVGSSAGAGWGDVNGDDFHWQLFQLLDALFMVIPFFIFLVITWKVVEPIMELGTNGFGYQRASD